MSALLPAMLSVMVSIFVVVGNFIKGGRKKYISNFYKFYAFHDFIIVSVSSFNCVVVELGQLHSALTGLGVQGGVCPGRNTVKTEDCPWKQSSNVNNITRQSILCSDSMNLNFLFFYCY